MRTRTVQGKSRARSLDISLPSLIAGHFKRKLLQAAKSADGKTELNDVRFAEDFTPSDFNSKLGKKLFDLCEGLFKKGREFVSQKEIFLWAEGQSRSCRNL